MYFYSGLGLLTSYRSQIYNVCVLWRTNTCPDKGKMSICLHRSLTSLKPQSALILFCFPLLLLKQAKTYTHTISKHAISELFSEMRCNYMVLAY